MNPSKNIIQIFAHSITGEFTYTVQDLILDQWTDIYVIIKDIADNKSTASNILTIKYVNIEFVGVVQANPNPFSPNGIGNPIYEQTSINYQLNSKKESGNQAVRRGFFSCRERALQAPSNLFLQRLS